MKWESSTHMQTRECVCVTAANAGADVTLSVCVCVCGARQRLDRCRQRRHDASLLLRRGKWETTTATNKMCGALQPKALVAHPEVLLRCHCPSTRAGHTQTHTHM